MARPATDDDMLRVECDPSLKERLIRVAEENQRSLSAQVRYALLAHVTTYERAGKKKRNR